MNFALVVSLLAIAATPAPIKIAAPGLTCVNLDEKTGEFLVDSLSQQLIKQGIHVITPKEISAVVNNERQKQLLGCTGEGGECLTELAGALGVDGILTGSVAKIGAGMAVNLKIVAASDSRMLSAHTARVKDDAALLDWFDDAAAAMANDLRVTLGRGAKPDAGVAVAKPVVPAPDPLMEKPSKKDAEAPTHEVEWGSRWYPARVLEKRDDGFTLIHYQGYSSTWDEWVAPSRLRELPGAKKPKTELPTEIDVEWKGSWYPAKVLERKADGSAYIKYDGYADSWNEWVAPARQRPRTPKP